MLRLIQGGNQPRFRPQTISEVVSDCYPYPSRFSTGGAIYFVACRDSSSAVKIGYATDLGRRVSALQNGCPHELEALTYFWSKDPEADEYAIHARYSEYRIRGEWFAPAPAILELILCVQEARRIEMDRTFGRIPTP